MTENVNGILPRAKMFNLLLFLSPPTHLLYVFNESAWMEIDVCHFYITEKLPELRHSTFHRPVSRTLF